ncbi:MAG: hypothetical protein QOE98_2279 [Gaiellaceae bacterium]|nr:hypothetical protein [Gaiellaceae bacterium]
MHPRFIPTVEQFRPFRSHPTQRYPSQRALVRSLLGSIAGGEGRSARNRPPGRGRLRPPAEFRPSHSRI